MSTFGFFNTSKKKEAPELTYSARTLRPIDEMQDHEFEAFIGKEFELDVECYPNYFLIMMKNHDSGKVVSFELSPVSTINMQKLAWCLYAFKFYTFNGKHYDWPMVAIAMMGYDTQTLRKANNMIIVEKCKPEDVMHYFKAKLPFINEVDIKEVAPLDGTLKKYSARLHADRMQELPYDSDYELSEEQAKEVKHYCQNDLDNTWLVRHNLAEQLQSRQALSDKYGLDLRSKSDAQIAEAVISKEIGKIKGAKPKRPTLKDDYTCQYIPPSFMSFKTAQFQKAFEDICSARFSLDNGGSPMWPKTLGAREKVKGKWVTVLKVSLGSSVYKLGMGGIHSSEKSVAYKSCSRFILKDRDVASYYPRIILNNKLFPKHLGEPFLLVYDGLVVARLTAKKAKDIIQANGLKITINGGFGKFGSMWSVLYSPDLMLQVTLTGQLCLGMLIEMLEEKGFSVVSANTDGLVSLVERSRNDEFEQIIKEWEKITDFETEETGYAALYSKDVNNYIAVKYEWDKDKNDWSDKLEKCKLKGAYGDPWSDKEAQIFRFHKNPSFLICTQAMQALILYGTPIAHTITQCRDIRQFLAVRDVKGGGHKNGLYVGKTIRWYISNSEKGTVNYVLSGNKVPETEGCKIIMDLPDDFPADINYDWYISRTNSMLIDIAYYEKEELSGQSKFF